MRYNILYTHTYEKKTFIIIFFFFYQIRVYYTAYNGLCRSEIYSQLI